MNTAKRFHSMEYGGVFFAPLRFLVHAVHGYGDDEYAPYFDEFRKASILSRSNT
jgi:hypothetical protein